MLAKNLDVLESIVTGVSKNPHTVLELAVINSLLKDLKRSDLQTKFTAELSAVINELDHTQSIGELFGAAFALQQHSRVSVNGKQSAWLIATLTKHEVKPGGPYAEANGTVDLLSNILIGLFLQFHDVRLAGLSQYVNDGLVKIDTYKNKEPTLYLAGLLSWINKKLLKKRIRSIQTKDSKYPQLLSYALLKIDPTHALKVTTSKRETSNKVDIIAGIALDDLLARHRSSQKTNTSMIANSVYKAVAKESDTYSEPLATYLKDITTKVKNADIQHEISLLPYYFFKAIKPTSYNEKRTAVNLGAANIFCWVAYTLYDDFIDGEGKAEHLSVANVAMRKSLSLLEATFKTKQERALVHSLFDRMDQANSWELEHTRFKVNRTRVHIAQIPEYGDLSILSDRATGHIIAPLCLARRNNFTQSEQQTLQQSLHHYLVARQLNDDLHDWQEDIANGQCTYIVAELLRGANVQPGSYSHVEIIKTLKRHFWNHGFAQLSRVALTHIETAQTMFKNIEILHDDAELLQFFKLIENSLIEARIRFKEKQEFLNGFKSSN